MPIRFSYKLPKLKFENGGLELLKWFALILMTGDHVNKYLFNETLPYLFEAGRLAMPIFVFVLAYNLARPNALERGAYQRTMIRLAVFGALATPAFVSLGSVVAGLPLNILFTLLIITAITALLDPDEPRNYLRLAGAALTFILGSAVVEFWWPAVAFGVAIWWYCKKPSYSALVMALMACTTLFWINGNHWALAALPVIAMARLVTLRVPRLRWVFYAYYPVHLIALLLVRIPMANAGYMFF